MKALSRLRQKSDTQLLSRLNEIAIAIRRVQAYNKGGAKLSELQRAKHGNGINTMALQKLRREQAQINTILTERKIKRDKEKFEHGTTQGKR